MDPNYTNYTTGFANPQQVYLRDSQSIGLPINSRLTNESFSPNVRFLNNYSGVQQQALSPFQIRSSAASNDNAFYRGTFQGEPQITTVGGANYFNNQDLHTQRSTQKVMRSRMVPVTQYVPVYEVEQVPVNAPLENQTIHQRVILHEPEAFKSRTYYEEKTQAHPTIVEETKVVYQQAPSKVNTKVVKVSQDPLVETVQGGWQSQYVAASRTSISPPAPLPREEKSCCSPWLLLLLGLLALAGILSAILLGKNGSSTEVSNSQKTQTSGTKVSSSNLPKNITSVPPLTNVVEVRGTTAVTQPTSVEPVTQSIQPLQYVAPTQISLVAKTQTPVSTQSPHIKPQTTNLISVEPVVISNPTPNNQATSYVVEPKSSSTIVNKPPTTYVSPLSINSVQPLTVSPTEINSVQPSVSPVKVNSAQPQTVYPTVISPTVTYATPTRVSSAPPTVVPPTITYVNPTATTAAPTVNQAVATPIPTANPTISAAQAKPASNSANYQNTNTLSSANQQRVIKAQTATLTPQPKILEPKEPFDSKVSRAPTSNKYPEITPDFVPAVQVSE